MKTVKYNNEDELKIGDRVIAVCDIDGKFRTKGLTGTVICENNYYLYSTVKFDTTDDFDVYLEGEFDGCTPSCLDVEYFEVEKIVEE